MLLQVTIAGSGVLPSIVKNMTTDEVKKSEGASA